MLAELFHRRRVLVTGGLGFIGSNLAIALVDRGAEVTLLDSLIPQAGGSLANIESIRDRVTVDFSDMRDAAALEVLVRDQDYIFNLAGLVSHSDSMRDPHCDLAVNCAGSVNLVEACRKHNASARLLFASTRQVYGRPESLPVKENHPARPIDVNGINKLAAEHYHLLYHQVYGIGDTVLRLTNTFGPRQQISLSRQGFAGFFIYQALRGGCIRLFGGGHQLRDFNYVDDVVDAMMRAITTDECMGRVLNLGDTQPYSLADFVAILAEHCDFAVEDVPFPRELQRIDIGDFYGDYSQLRLLTGWEPQVTLPEGIARTLEFYRQHSKAYDVCPATS